VEFSKTKVVLAVGALGHIFLRELESLDLMVAKICITKKFYGFGSAAAGFQNRSALSVLS